MNGGAPGATCCPGALAGFVPAAVPVVFVAVPALSLTRGTSLRPDTSVVVRRSLTLVPDVAGVGAGVEVAAGDGAAAAGTVTGTAAGPLIARSRSSLLMARSLSSSGRLVAVGEDAIGNDAASDGAACCGWGIATG
jgi:hypothetical protein